MASSFWRSCFSSVYMESIRRQASKLREQVAKQQQVISLFFLSKKKTNPFFAFVLSNHVIMVLMVISMWHL